MGLKISDQPRAASAQRLRNGSGDGAFDVVGGSLAWDPRFEAAAPQDAVPLRRGGIAAVGSLEAASDAYMLSLELLGSVDRLAILFRGLLPRWRYGDPVPAGAPLEVLTVYVNAQIQWATSLRTLSRLYRAARLSPDIRPAAAARGGVALDRIRFWGIADPMSRGNQRLVSIRSAADWEILGNEIIRQWLEAYPELAVPPLGQRDELLEDLLSDRARLEAESEAAAMGAAWVPVVIWLGVLLIAAGVVVYVAGKAIGAVQAFLGHYQQYVDALVKRWERESEACARGDQAACERADTLANRIENYTPTRGVGVMIIGGLFVLGGLWFWGRRR